MKARIAAAEADRDTSAKLLVLASATLDAERLSAADLRAQIAELQAPHGSPQQLEKQGGRLISDADLPVLSTCSATWSGESPSRAAPSASKHHLYSTPVISGYGHPWPAMSSSQASPRPVDATSAAASPVASWNSGMPTSAPTQPLLDRIDATVPIGTQPLPWPAICGQSSCSRGPYSFAANANTQLRGWCDRHITEGPPSLQGALEAPYHTAVESSKTCSDPLSIRIVSSGVRGELQSYSQQQDGQRISGASEMAIRSNQRRHPGAKVHHLRMRHPQVHPRFVSGVPQVQQRRQTRSAGAALPPTTECTTPVVCPLAPSSLPKPSAFAAMSRVPF